MFSADALHKVSVYLFNTSQMGSVEGQSVIANWLCFCSKCLMASLGLLSLSSTVCLKLFHFASSSVEVRLEGQM